MKNRFLVLKCSLPLFSLVLFLSVLQSSFCFAQEKNEKKYKWGCAVAINSTEAQIGDPEWDSWGYATGNFKVFGDIRNKSLSISIIPQYLISNEILVRFEFGITSILLTNSYDANAHLVSNNPSVTKIINQSIEQRIYRFIPSMQWNFIKKKTIESFCGIKASYLNYSDMKYHNRFESKELTSDILVSGFEDNATATGGFAIGFGALVGFNIYLHKHVSFGAEFSSVLEYKKLGGSFSGESIDLINPNSTASQTYSYTTNSYKGFQFSKILSSFNITFYL